jgi:hypothetical protein
LGSASTRLFSGLSVVISSKEEVDMNRRPGLVGLYLRTGISDELRCLRSRIATQGVEAKETTRT